MVSATVRRPRVIVMAALLAFGLHWASGSAGAQEQTIPVNERASLVEKFLSPRSEVLLTTGDGLEHHGRFERLADRDTQLDARPLAAFSQGG